MIGQLLLYDSPFLQNIYIKSNQSIEIIAWLVYPKSILPENWYWL
jgi:hypothetical protein